MPPVTVSVASLWIAPPASAALPVNAQFAIVASPPFIWMNAPPCSAVLFEKLASVIVIDSAQLSEIAPPCLALFPVKVAPVTVATLQLAMAPPSLFLAVLPV